MFDTHAHLSDRAFDQDLFSVLENGRSAGIEYLVTVGYDFESCQKNMMILDREDNIYGAVGIHPHEAGSYRGDLSEIEQFLTNPKVVAIGETGLDYYRNFAAHDLQKELFREHIRLAKKRHLPVVVHTRRSFDDALAILNDEDYRFAVFHCYSGDVDFALKIVEMGFYISFSGSITFAGNKLAEIIKKIPKDRILIETDAPYLTPVPLRGQRNEPAYLRYIAQKISEILNININEVDRLTTENAKRFFQLK